ncbi:MAG: hypothetical protein NVS1B10_08300 [Candidatus Saccharimonadales bacterium]
MHRGNSIVSAHVELRSPLPSPYDVQEPASSVASQNGMNPDGLVLIDDYLLVWGTASRDVQPHESITLQHSHAVAAGKEAIKALLYPQHCD